MDKYEFRVSLNEINSLVQERRFEEAAEIADTIDWRKVKSPDTLCRISDIYKICKDYERARDILDLANQRNPHIPNIVYSLCELTIFLYGQTGSQADLAKALGLRQEYESECPDDPKRLILEYKFYKVSPVTLTEKIATLEQLRDEAPSARWEYELASLYHQAGQDDLALAECGSIQRNYSGKFADKAAALAQEINPSEPVAGQDLPEAAEALASESAPVEPAAETPAPAAPAEEPVREAAPAEAAPAEEPAYYSGSVDEAPQAEEPADAPTEPIRTERAPRYEAPVQEEPMQAEPAAEETPASDENLSVGQVYDEWERIRRDIRRRNDEQRAQRIMQDTGPLLQDFDETARHGLIEAIEKDAARARRQVRSGASSILGDDGYDRGDRYTDRYNDDRGYRESRYDERDDRYDDRDSYYNDAPRGNRRSYEPLPSQDEYYPEDDASGEQYPEDRYADDQYTDSASSEEQYVETLAPQETYAEESVPEERDNSITSETVHVGPEENDQSSEPRRGSAFAAAVAGAAAAHLADEAEDVATRRWNSDEIRGALAAAKAGVEATKDVTADGITAAASTAAAVADKAQDAIATPTAEPAQPVFDAAAERARIEAEVRAQIAAEQEAARQKAEAEAAQKAAAEEAARKAAEAEAARKAAEEQARREAEEAARKAAEQEAARKAAEEKIRKEAEEKARKDAEEQARAQMYAEIEARVRAEYEQKAQAEAAAKAEAEAAQKAAAEEAARKAAEEEAARKAAEAAAIAAAAVAVPETEEVVEEDVDELAHGEEDGINQISPAEEPDVRDDDNADDEAEAVAHKDADTADYDNVEPVDTDAHEGDNADEIAERHIPENRPVGAAQSNYDEDAPASAASSIATANDKAPTPEELRLFGPFYRMRENREQVTTALDKISLASYTGNLIITGNAVTARRVAQGLLELTREADSNFTGKIAKATGTALNNLTDEKFHSILSKIENGALIIEHASTMDEAAVRRMYNELEGRDHGVIVVLMDAKKPLDEFLETYKTYVSSFSARVDIRPLNDRALVDYGKDYANSKDYALDEMAELALSSRISGMQSPSHRVTLKEVRDIIDEAITYASRKTPHALMEVLSRKRYDAEDRIILHEKDFQHS